MTHKNREKIKKFHVWSAVCSLLRAEGFFCNFDALHRHLHNKKPLSEKEGSIPARIRIQSGPWIRIRIQEGKNDPQK
jgi:hypothetical protein